MRLEHCGTIDNNIVVKVVVLLLVVGVTNFKIFQLQHSYTAARLHQPGRPLWSVGFIREEMMTDLFNKQTTPPLLPPPPSSFLPRNPKLPNFDKEKL